MSAFDMITFDKWFAAQHGPRHGMPSVTDQDLKDRIEAGETAKAEAQRRAMWDEQRKSALYAWQVRDGDKQNGDGHDH